MDTAANHLNDLRNGNEMGLKHYMAEFGKPLRYYAYSIIHNKEAAEEIVADAFVKLWQGRDRAQAPESVKAFLYLATRNACLDYLESPRNRPPLDIAVAADMANTDQDMLTRIIHAELMERIETELDKLPAQQAAIFRMTYIDGLSTEEICERLGTTPGTVYQARSRVAATLKHIARQRGFLVYPLALHCLMATYTA